MSLKIGLITGEYPPMQGGVGAFTQELARALHELGHQLHIITHRSVRPVGDERRWQALREPVQQEFAEVYPFIHRWRWSALPTIVDVAIRYELDVVNIQYQAAAYDMRSAAVNFLPWRLKGVVPTAVTFHDLRVPYLFPKAGRLRQAAVRWMAKQAGGVIVTNQADYQALQPQLQTPLRQIPIGSNIATYAPDEAEITAVRQQLGLTSADHLLGYFGFLNESKGADSLIHALAQLDERVHLLFIGGQTGSSDPANNQSFLSQLQALITQLGLDERVHWTGFVAGRDVSVALHAADLMVMPYRDGVSLRRGTLMATLAHGRPLITTHPQTPTHELVHGENCWFAPVDDPQKLAEAINHLLPTADLRHKLGQGAAQVADLFTWDKIAAQTAEFYTRIIGL